MKKTILILMTAAFIASAMMIGCNTPAQDVENAKEDVKDANEDVKDANEDLDKANQAYMAEVDTFRLQVAEKVAANNKNMAEFKVRVANEKADVKLEYEKKIAELEKKNSDMQMKMDNYKVEVKDDWKTFKNEFNRDMDEIGKAFSNLTKKNEK